MANEGRPTFDLSSFSTFAFPTLEPETPPVDPISPAGGVSPHEHATSANLNTEAVSANEYETLVDLLKFGPPDALAQLTHGLPATLLTVVHNATETVRAQVDIETGRRRFSKEEIKGHVYRQEHHLDLAKDDKQLDKGKGVEAPQVVRTSARQPSVASDQTDTTFSSPPFYTPSEGATPSEESTTADFESDAGTDVLTAVPTAVRSGDDARPPLGPRPWSASAIPRRRNFIKSIFRKLSDGDTRRQVLRKSVGSLQLKAKLKQVWHRETETGFVPFPNSLQRLVCQVLSGCPCTVPPISYFAPNKLTPSAGYAFPALTTLQPETSCDYSATTIANPALVASSVIPSRAKQTGHQSAVFTP